MIDVGAVGISRSLRDFQILWARSLRPQDVSVHIVFERAKSFNTCRPEEHAVTGASSKRGDTQVATPPGENRAWGILDGFFFHLDRHDHGMRRHRSLIEAIRVRCS
jgi:hypothetical protein